MRKAFVLTAYNRPEYLRQVLASLKAVRGWEGWHVVFSIDNSPVIPEVVGMIQGWLPFFEECTTTEIIINEPRLGVLEHPFVVFDRLFREGYDYVLRSEDDLLHGEDVLEYHSWAAERYVEDQSVGIVTAFSADNRSHAEVHRRIGLGSPLLIGTWRDRWENVLRETWDHDYSTGVADTRGWDHNIHLRIFPSLGLHAILPNHAKVEHIGVVGEHSTPEIFYSQPLDLSIPPQHYREVPE